MFDSLRIDVAVRPQNRLRSAFGPAACIDSNARGQFTCGQQDSEGQMKLVSAILGLLFVAIAVVYVLTPAGSLPNFFPGFETGSAHIHLKHAVVSLVLGVGLFWIAFMARRSPARP